LQIHEYQAKSIFKEYGIPVPEGEIATNIKEAVDITRIIGSKVVVKAQVHSGGRGKVGGVQLVENIEDLTNFLSEMIGKNLKTNQTVGNGLPVNKVLIEKITDIQSELYLAVTMDHESGCPIVIVSTEGGMEIETIAEKNPEKILKILGDPLLGLLPYKIRKLFRDLSIDPNLSKEFTSILLKIYKIFIEKDCSLIEINPLVISNNRFIALDAKITIEDDALFRQREIQNLFDDTQIDPLELEALKSDLSYVKLYDGDVGCMVNGAGLAMATMDITVKAGTRPANFLDVGGSADQERIQKAFEIIIQDSDVKVILVNLFGGILRCDIAANGIIEAIKGRSSYPPIIGVFRGTNSKEAKEKLILAKINLEFAQDLIDAAKKMKEKL
jgi:succinyl-CoA synthetase beta subunit